MAFWIPEQPVLTKEQSYNNVYNVIFRATCDGVLFTSPFIKFLEESDAFDCVSRWASNLYTIEFGGATAAGGGKIINITMGITGERFYMLTP